MRRLKVIIQSRQQEKEIERINNPRRMIFVSDVILMGLFSVVAMAILWLAIVGTCYVTYGVQIMLGVA